MFTIRLFRPEITKTKEFVKKHRTAVACAATAVVAWKLSHEITLKGVLEETTDMAYTWGKDAGQMQVYLDVAYDFIDQKDLTKEFIDFATVPA